MKTALLTLAFSLLIAVNSTAVLAQDGGDEGKSAEIASLFNDFLHFARIGKFTHAEAFAEKLLKHPDLTPQSLLAISDQDADSIPTLITLISHTSLRESAQKILDQIREGEFLERKNLARIRENIEKLGGQPQMEYNAIQRLKESGEYAVPSMIDALSDNTKSKLWPRIIRALPRIGKPAVSPLTAALNTSDRDVQKSVVWALGDIGYPQATPYLLKLLGTKDLPEETRREIESALDRIHTASDRPTSSSSVEAFLSLANQFYDEVGAVKADPRVSTANVWYWESSRLREKPVPTEIYGQVMAMRACEETLLLKPDCTEAIALWLASNIRRESRLGMDVESTEPGDGDKEDKTRPENFPRSVYFSRAAGPEYCHLVLGRAIKDAEKDVALGAIAALDVVAGENSLIGNEDYKQPLAGALRFPDAEVRIKAAIALARALPKNQFRGSDLVGPVLADALRQNKKEQFIIVDADSRNLNRIAGELRENGGETVAETNFYVAMERARKELPSVRAIILATDIDTPGIAKAIAELRSEYRFSRTPVIVLTKPEQEYLAKQAVKGAHAMATSAASKLDEIEQMIEELSNQEGAGPLAPELATELALQATEAIKMVAVDGKTVIDTATTISALVSALDADEQQLRINAADALALIDSPEGQQATCEIALNEGNNEELRLAMFNALANSAKRQGNRLLPEQVDLVVKAALETEDLVMRTAASKALGALNLKQNEASEIIRSYYGG